MGGHSAWRKRLARGELAKQSSGAISRHRPHFGRKGKDLIKNRKGHIAGGNPKKKARRNVGLGNDDDVNADVPRTRPLEVDATTATAVVVLATLSATAAWWVSFRVLGRGAGVEA